MTRNEALRIALGGLAILVTLVILGLGHVR